MNKLNLFIGISVFSVAASVLVACGSKGEPQEQPATATPVEVAVAPEQTPAETVTPAPAPETEPPVETAAMEPTDQTQEAPPTQEIAAVTEPPPFLELPKAAPIKRRPAPVQTIEPATPKPTAQEIVSNILNSMQWGAIDLKTPPTMKKDEKAAAQLVVDTSTAWQNMKKVIDEQAVKNGLRIDFAAQANAHLTGNGFQIASVAPETQSIVSPGKLDWQWDIKANAPGKQNVHLDFKVTVSADGGVSDTRTVKSLDKTIDVTDAAAPAKPDMAMLNNLWPWIIGIVLVILIAVIAIRKLGNKG